MPDLFHTLNNYDLGFLRIIAQAWGIDLDALDAGSALPILVEKMQERPLFNDVVNSLPAEAQNALEWLRQADGHVLWSLFTRRAGEVRIMGAGRRDREHPERKPASPAEMLWYRGMVGRAFLNLDAEPQEYAYLPDEFIKLLKPMQTDGFIPPGRPAAPGEYAHLRPANDHILDQTCTWLAVMRLPKPLSEAEKKLEGMQLPFVQSLLGAAGLIDSQGQPNPAQVRTFLEADRAKALSKLFSTWLNSSQINDLRLLPGLAFEGEWRNDPLVARRTILEFMEHLPSNTWWSLASFINAIHDIRPDFQRPAGDYDSWFIRDEATQEYLRGFGHWEDVEGKLIRWIITVPLHLLGAIDLAAPDEKSPPTAFHRSAWAEALLNGKVPPGLLEEDASIVLTSSGQVSIPRLAPRTARYQISRFCIWEGEQKGAYRYRLTSRSLGRAAEQGLRATQLTALLRKFVDSGLPPSLVKALERWEKYGSQAAIQPQTLLRVSSPEILLALQKSPAGKWLGETLNPTTATIKPGRTDQVLSALAELGFLAESEVDV
jgi:hypothetical protein